jgi:ribonuclease HI
VKDEEAWTVFGDGSCRTFGAGAVAVLISPSKIRTCYAVRLEFMCTNNIAEYKAVLLGLRNPKVMGIRRAVLKSDSQVITGHVDKSSKAKDPKLEKYLDTIRRMEASFEGFLVKNIPRGDNEQADLLAKSATQGLPLPQKCSSKLLKHLRLSSWKGLYSQYHLCIAKIGEQKLYPFSRATTLRMMKFT